MRRFAMGGAALFMSGLASAVLVAVPKDKDEEKRAPLPMHKCIALKADSVDGVIKGVVEYDGAPPERKVLEAIRQADVKECRDAPEDQQIDQTWIVDPKTKRVANVVVFLKPPHGKHFAFDEEIGFSKEVALDQPFCAFVPHVAVAFPVYWDGRRYAKSGQVFRIANSSPGPRCTYYTGDLEDIGSKSFNIRAGQSATFELRAASLKPVRFANQLRHWMSAVVWSFDHPYAAVTDKNGEFTIKNVPTGVELTLVAWHEAFHPNELKGFHEEKIKLAKGQKVEKQLTVKK